LLTTENSWFENYAAYNPLVAAAWGSYCYFMSTVSEIRTALPGLTTEELRAVDAALREQFRGRKIGILYDDAYGLWTEDDQASAAAEAFALMDQEPRRHEPS
jgi:hypothetical protein